MSEMIHVEVAYALPQKQKIVTLELTEGATVEDAIQASGLVQMFPGLDLASAKVGIFGKSTKRNVTLREGDRVEIYRPLKADPKEVRKARAAKAKKTT